MNSEQWAHDGHFGERVVQLRTRLGLSRQELGEKADIDRTTIFHYEKGGRLPKTGIHLRGLSEALESTPGFLLLGEED